MRTFRTMLPTVLVAAAVALGAAGCGDTWEGVKEDSRENLEEAGEGVEELGEEMQDAD